MLFTTKKIAIDLGTVNSLVYIQGRGIILNEPTVVAMNNDDERIMAVGTEAREMLGRTPEQISALRPLKDGVVANYRATEALVKYFLRQAIKGKKFQKAEVLICTPAGATSIERRALIDATLGAGAQTAYIIEESLVAAIGANMPIGSAEGNMIVDIGGGTTEIAVISLGGLVTHTTERLGGNHLDETIALHLRRAHNLLIGDRMAEEVKLAIAAAMRPEAGRTYEVKGRDTVEGLPKTVTVTAEEISTALQPSLLAIIDAIKRVLEDTPPELASDIIDRGIILSGGGALLPNFDRLISLKTGVPVQTADQPLLCVANGAGKVIDQFETFRPHLRRQ